MWTRTAQKHAKDQRNKRYRGQGLEKLRGKLHEKLRYAADKLSIKPRYINKVHQIIFKLRCSCIKCTWSVTAEQRKVKKADCHMRQTVGELS